MVANNGKGFAGRSMTDETPLDAAHRAMIDPSAEDLDHQRYYARLAAAELFVLLEEEVGDSFAPQLIEDDGQQYALAFDREDKLAAFHDTPQDYIAMSGRNLIAALLEADIGLGINLGMDAATMLPPAVLAWIDEQISPEVATEEARIGEIGAPNSAGAELVQILSERLPILSGMADHAILAETEKDNSSCLLLAIVDVPENARASCAGAVAEALRLTQVDAPLDSVFVSAGDPLHVATSKVGLRFDIPTVNTSAGPPSAPGMDPDKPPILN